MIQLMQEMQRRPRPPVCSLPDWWNPLLAKSASLRPTSVQHDVVDHIALVFGVIEAEGAAQVFGDVFRFTAVVTGLHMYGEGVSAVIQRQNKGQ